jgi:hypothetical protein
VLHSRNPMSSRAFTACRRDPILFGCSRETTSGRGSETYSRSTHQRTALGCPCGAIGWTHF